jgi:hypothetical protein
MDFELIELIELSAGDSIFGPHFPASVVSSFRVAAGA